jgi:hypothetical protein
MNQDITVQQRSPDRPSYFDLNRPAAGAVGGLIGGIAGGIVAGIGARLAMRAVAYLGEQLPSYSVEGTLFIIGLGAFMGGLVGLLFGFIQSFLPGSVRLKGVLFGLILSLIFATLVLLSEPEGELALVSQAMIALLFAPLPLAYGLVLGLVTARLIPEGDLPVENATLVRSAGLLTMICALAGACIKVIMALNHPTAITFQSTTLNTLNHIAGGLVILMFLFGIVGLIRSDATGNRTMGKIGLGIALLCIPLLGIVAMAEGLKSIMMDGLLKVLLNLRYDDDAFLLLIPLLLSILGMLLAGIAVLQSKRWRGWRGFIPLLIGLYPIPYVILLHHPLLPSLLKIPFTIRVEIGYRLSALYFLCWLALGLALRIETGRPLTENSQ